MPIQFYRKPDDKNLYEVGSNRVIGATEFGLGTPNAGKGFQEITPPVVTDPLKDMAKSVGEAGLGVTDFTKLAADTSAPTQAEQDKIKADLGITDLENKAYALPSQSTEQLFSAKYGELGLTDLKSKIADLETQITAKKNVLNDAIGKVSENPWLDEASRVGRVKRLTELANADIGNVNDQYTNLKDLYNSGVNEINNYVLRSTTDFNNEKNSNATKLTYLLKKAEDQIKTAQTDNASKVYRYIPDYLQAYQSSAKGTGKSTTKTVKVGTGAAAKTYLITYDVSGKETKRELVGSGNTPSPENSSNPNQLKLIEQNLLAQKGKDGFVSPDDYALAKQDWIQAGGAPAAFDTKFKTRRNPNNPYYKLTGKEKVAPASATSPFGALDFSSL